MASDNARGEGPAASGPDTDDPAPAADKLQPASIGAELRAAREAMGLRLADVAERTKVRPGILSDIEDDRHDRLPALTYTLGFVKAHARTVGLDPQMAADRYRRESMKGEPVPTLVDLAPLEERRLPSRGLVVAISALLLAAIGGLWAWGAGWFDPPLPVAAPAEPAQPDEQADAAEAAQADAALPPADPAADPAAAVRLTAIDEVWLAIRDRDNGETLFMGTLAKGQQLDLPPGRPWALRTGRAGALEVRVGDRVLPPLGGPVESLRDRSLAPADLLALPAAG